MLIFWLGCSTSLRITMLQKSQNQGGGNHPITGFGCISDSHDPEVSHF